MKSHDFLPTDWAYAVNVSNTINVATINNTSTNNKNWISLLLRILLI